MDTQRVYDKIRGRYYGGGMTVTCKHWWSPKHRKTARQAAQLCAHAAPGLKAQAYAKVIRNALYGDPL